MQSDRPAGSRRIVDHVFRVATSAIFIVAGLGHLVRADIMTARLTNAPLGRWLASQVDPEPLMWASGVVLLAGGVALALGFRQRIAAALLALVLLPITITTHVGHGGDPGPLLKNVALLGSLLHFALGGPTSAHANASAIGSSTA